MTTQKAFFSYEEVIDLHTESERVSVIGIHTPTGDTPRKLCPGFFEQFKKYKYLGCKIALVPAATLPADPLQVSYEAGEPTIDPRDMLNPILWHGCHGNDLGDILNRLYAANAVTGDSSTMHLGSDAIDMVSYLNDDAMDFFGEISTNISFMESLYYRALTDRTWKKANIQRGFRIAGLRPRVYSLASTFQIMGASSLDSIGNVPSPFEIDVDVSSITPPIGTIDIGNPVSNANKFLTPRTVPLGWLDTRNVLTMRDAAEVSLDADDVGLAPTVINNMVKQGTVPVELPKIFMGVILLPPAYKTEFYFRMIVTHFFAFAGFRGCSMSNDMLENPNYHDWNEQISAGEGDDPEPDPPEPVIEYPAVLLKNATAVGYNRAEYLASADAQTEFLSMVDTDYIFTEDTTDKVKLEFLCSKSGSIGIGSVSIGDKVTVKMNPNDPQYVGFFKNGSLLTQNNTVSGFLTNLLKCIDASEFGYYLSDAGLVGLFDTANVVV